MPPKKSLKKLQNTEGPRPQLAFTYCRLAWGKSIPQKSDILYTTCQDTMHNQPQTASQTHSMHYSPPPKWMFFCCSVKHTSQTIKLAIHHFENSFYTQIRTLGPGDELKGSKNRMLKFRYSVMKISKEHQSGWSASVCQL